MAESIARHHGLDAYSAGTMPERNVSEEAISVLDELGYPTNGLHTKTLDEVYPNNYQKIISMGCGVECPNIPIDEDWNLDDPLGQKRDFFRLIRDEIERKIQNLEFNE
tara:strand:- start:254 stop:577 length:324 start_codon:yes stop_codon:yes gene_type:complete